MQNLKGELYIYAKPALRVSSYFYVFASRLKSLILNIKTKLIKLLNNVILN
jgi:hypothetical protein